MPVKLANPVRREPLQLTNASCLDFAKILPLHSEQLCISSHVDKIGHGIAPHCMTEPPTCFMFHDDILNKPALAGRLDLGGFRSQMILF